MMKDYTKFNSKISKSPRKRSNSFPDQDFCVNVFLAEIQIHDLGPYYNSLNEILIFNAQNVWKCMKNISRSQFEEIFFQRLKGLRIYKNTQIVKEREYIRVNMGLVIKSMAMIK